MSRHLAALPSSMSFFLHLENLKLLCVPVHGERPIRIKDYTSSQTLKPSFSSAGNNHSFNPQVVRPQCVSESPGGLIKHRLLGSTYKVSDLVGLGWDPRICISDKFPGDADAKNTLGEPLP